VNRFIGSSLLVSKISSYILKITVNIAHVTSHTKCVAGIVGSTSTHGMDVKREREREREGGRERARLSVFVYR
jgi:hypothetical protein